jgi:hypothetical protein
VLQIFRQIWKTQQSQTASTSAPGSPAREPTMRPPQQIRVAPAPLTSPYRDHYAHEQATFRFNPYQRSFVVFYFCPFSSCLLDRSKSHHKRLALARTTASDAPEALPPCAPCADTRGCIHEVQSPSFTPASAFTPVTPSRYTFHEISMSYPCDLCFASKYPASQHSNT